MRKRLTIIIAVATVSPFLWVLPSARSRSPRQASEFSSYSLSNGATLQLSGDWSPRNSANVPPPPTLASSAPPITFLDFQVFENADDQSQLELALSNNAFRGRDAYWLDSEMHRSPASGAGVASYLFYFFFPPPRTCLEGARSNYERAARESSSNADKDAPPADVRINFDCEYAPTLADFYSSFIARSLTFRRESNAEHREGALRDLYLPPMDQREFNGLTFFIFEAQDRRQITLATTNHFNLPDSLQGTQPDYLWAIVAPSPFPFVPDATHKNRPIVHVVYAGTGLGADKKSAFLNILHNLQIPKPY